MFPFSLTKRRITATLGVPTLLFLIAAAPVVPPSATTTAPRLMAGEWQLSQSVNLGPDADQIQTRKACYSEANLQTDAMAPFKPVPPPGREAVACQTQNVIIEGNWVRFETRCAMPFGTMVTSWQGNFADEDFMVVGNAQF
ncbi:MAG: hypothetical protein ACK5Z6_13495 [Hyphomonadaceae bacterium]